MIVRRVRVEMNKRTNGGEEEVRVRVVANGEMGGMTFGEGA